MLLEGVIKHKYHCFHQFTSCGTLLKVDDWFYVLMGAQERCLFMDFPLPLRWSCLSSAGGSWSTPPVSAWWGRPLSAVSWSGRSSRTTEWSLWRGTSLWTVNTGKSWRSAANVWESLLLYRWCSLMDTTSGSACLCDLYTQSNENQIFSKLNLGLDLFCRVLRKYWAWMSPESFKTFWWKLRLVFWANISSW